MTDQLLPAQSPEEPDAQALEEVSAQALDEANAQALEASAVGSDRWMLLLRFAGSGLAVTFTFTLVVVAQEFVPQLAAITVIFAMGVALTWWRPRLIGIALGGGLTWWFVSQFIMWHEVAPDLVAPHRTGLFLATLGMIIFPGAGAIGLIGLLRRLPPGLVPRVIQTTMGLMAGAILVGVVASFVAG